MMTLRTNTKKVSRLLKKPLPDVRKAAESLQKDGIVPRRETICYARLRGCNPDHKKPSDPRRSEDYCCKSVAPPNAVTYRSLASPP